LGCLERYRIVQPSEWVGIIYFLVLPEMKNHRPPGNSNGKESTAMVLKTLQPDVRSIVNVLVAHGET